MDPPAVLDVPSEIARRAGHTKQIEAIFRARPMTWIDAHEFMELASFAWRTRVSDVRKIFTAEGGVLENRLRRPDLIVVSEYRYLPYEPQGRDADAPRPDAIQQTLGLR